MKVEEEEGSGFEERRGMNEEVFCVSRVICLERNSPDVIDLH